MPTIECGDFTFIWVCEGDVMSGSPRHYACAMEEAYYSEYNLGDLFVLVADNDNAIPIVKRADYSLTGEIYGDFYHGRLVVIDPSGFTHEATYRLDFRA